MRLRVFTFVAVLVLLGCSEASVEPLRLKITDESGADFPNVLVIVKSLEGKGEIFRALTNSAGSVPERDLNPGLYRVIATCPYGICRTKISEFLVSGSPVEIELKLSVFPTRGNSVIVGPPNRMKVEVLDTQGKPAPSAEVLVRDSNAEYEQWYKTNGNGEVDVEPLGTMITFVVLYNRTLTTETISSEAIQKLWSEGKKLVIRLK